MLHVHGTVSAADMQSYLVRACSTHTLPAELTTATLRLPTLGPPSLAPLRLPLQICKLRPGDGGLGLPTLGLTCHAAYAAQLQTNSWTSIQALTADAPLCVDDLLQTSSVRAYNGALQHLIQHAAKLWQVSRGRTTSCLTVGQHLDASRST